MLLARKTVLEQKLAATLIPESIPCSIAEVDCACNLLVEVDALESPRVWRLWRRQDLRHGVEEWQEVVSSAILLGYGCADKHPGAETSSLSPSLMCLETLSELSKAKHF